MTQFRTSQRVAVLDKPGSDTVVAYGTIAELDWRGEPCRVYSNGQMLKVTPDIVRVLPD